MNYSVSIVCRLENPHVLDEIWLGLTEVHCWLVTVWSARNCSYHNIFPPYTKAKWNSAYLYMIIYDLRLDEMIKPTKNRVD